MWIIGILLLIVIIVIIIANIVDSQYSAFVKKHSNAIRRLNEINEKYKFREIKNLNLEHSYDTEINFDSVSPRDYLTYQLQFMQDEVIENIRIIIENNNKISLYKNEIDMIDNFGTFDVEKLPKDRTELLRQEKIIFNKNIQKPILTFNIEVTLFLTNKYGQLKTYKKDTFELVEIEELIMNIKNRRNNRFLNEETWKSICKVERAKVSNKLRFAVYERDGYRCCKCKNDNDLEIDHIFPISKGGKTTFDNLQTLCRSCNKEKSNIVEGVNSKTYNPTKRYCKICGAPLKLIYGRYGKFYGCINYPKCDYKELE